MIDGNAIVAQTRQGSVQPTWQVLRGQSSYFYRQAGLGAVVLALGAAGIVYLLANPDTIYGYGLSDNVSISSGEFSFWRSADFVVVGLFALLGIATLIWRLAQSTNASQQLLVLMPEGFVMSTNKTQTYAFANLRSISVTVRNGTYYLNLLPASGASSVRLQIDGRFGNPKQVTQQIVAARDRFAAAKVGAQQPPVNR